MSVTDAYRADRHVRAASCPAPGDVRAVSARVLGRCPGTSCTPGAAER
ncbi:hypothetical protein [Streptomyces sp. URMC 129]